MIYSKKPTIYIEENQNAFNRRLAEFFCTAAKEAVISHNRFHVALSGGSTPRNLHRLLAKPPFRDEVPWQKTHLFWVDERCVPKENKDSNYGNVRADLLDKIPIPDHHVHPMHEVLSCEDEAEKYQQILKKELDLSKEMIPVFDLVLLGLGTDGHVASLFPGTIFEKKDTRWVVSVTGGNPNVRRLTLTYPVLNHGKKVVFMVSGKGKAEIVNTVFNNPGRKLPAQFIQPENGQLIWVMDKEASSLYKT